MTAEQLYLERLDFEYELFKVSTTIDSIELDYDEERYKTYLHRQISKINEEISEIKIFTEDEMEELKSKFIGNKKHRIYEGIFREEIKCNYCARISGIKTGVACRRMYADQFSQTPEKRDIKERWHYLCDEEKYFVPIDEDSISELEKEIEDELKLIEYWEELILN